MKYYYNDKGFYTHNEFTNNKYDNNTHHVLDYKEYDKHGNWIKLVATIKDKDYLITTREYTYY